MRRVGAPHGNLESHIERRAMAARRRRWPRVLAGVASTFVLLATGLPRPGRFSMTASTPTSTPWTRPTNSAPGPPGTPRPANRSTSWSWGGQSHRQGEQQEVRQREQRRYRGSAQRHHLLFHISGDRTRALGMSIPRDSLVTLPTMQRTGKVSNRAVTPGGSTRPSTSVVRAARSRPWRNSPASTSTISS